LWHRYYRPSSPFRSAKPEGNKSPQKGYPKSASAQREQRRFFVPPADNVEIASGGNFPPTRRGHVSRLLTYARIAIFFRVPKSGDHTAGFDPNNGGVVCLFAGGAGWVDLG